MVGSSLGGFLSGSILAGTPLLYATLGEVISERAGMINLGLEGVMLMGASARRSIRAMRC
jgi:simple sugar transport system permease protein